jgi:hypothetical protein
VTVEIKEKSNNQRIEPEEAHKTQKHPVSRIANDFCPRKLHNIENIHVNPKELKI